MRARLKGGAWCVGLLSFVMVVSFSERAAAVCAGDCDGDRAVTVNELVTGVAIALGNAGGDGCVAVDRDGSGEVSIDELVVAVGNALGGCPPEPPTGTHTETATPTRTVTATFTDTPTPTATETATPTATPNEPPVIVPHGVYRTYPDEPIALPLPVEDPDGSPLLYAATDVPDGADVGASSGILSWVPRPDQAGPVYVPFTATDPGGLSASSTVAIQVELPDSCVETQCDPATGCQAELKPLAENCCTAMDPPRVEQAVGECPQGKVVFVGRNYPRGGFGRISNCHWIRPRGGIQAGPVVVLHLETRCIDPVGVRFGVRLEAADAVVFDEVHGPTDFSPRADGYAELFAEPFAVNSMLTADMIEGREANLTVWLVDRQGVEVRTALRVVLTFNSVPILPPP